MLSPLPSCCSTLRPTSRKQAAWLFLLRPLPTATLNPCSTCPGWCECMYHGRLHVYSDPGDHDYFMYILKLMIVLSAVEINFLVNPR